jgi:hypothetical protein
MTAVNPSLRQQLDQALRDEAEALQLAARLAASRANGRLCVEAIQRAEALRARRVGVQRQVRESRSGGAPHAAD